ncbi:MAG: type 1 glutamine amidotransferase [Candidatus Omnitrophica bacterium]|nr:type 1 glutamine amidotransferase [Candidatus Omnitrophota bacterium]
MSGRILIIKHVEIEGAGTIERFFQNTDWSLATLDFTAGGFPPDDLNDIKAIISMGGPMNVYEEADYPFLRDEDLFLKKAIKKEIPILGICLGAQLLAKACGAEVRKAPEKEMGWHRIELTADGEKDPFFAGLSKELEVFQWHEDAFDIPKSAVCLANSKSCHNQAFRFGKNAYGLQFHIEVTPAIIGSWVKEYIKDEKERLVAKDMLIDAYEKREAFEKQANMVYLNFAKIMAGFTK